MAWIVKTPEGRYRVNWRDESGRQRARTLRTKREATTYLAQVDADMARGVHVDPHAARRILLHDYATRWHASRTVEIRTHETAAAMLRTHVLPRWGEVPLAKIDHLSVQEWVADLGARRAPATVAAAFGVLSMILDVAVRARLLAVNPCDGVRLPRRRADASPMRTISRADLHGRLLPAVPGPFRALVGLAGGAGLRWGECVGLGWEAVDFDRCTVHVRRVVVETAGRCELRAYPKSRAGARRLPLPEFAVDLLLTHQSEHVHSLDLVFATSTGGALRRSTFRRRVWLPTLERAGLDPGLRFHDLRHSYATWLVSDGVPVNVVQRLMGHESASTTLNRYVHAPDDYDERVRQLVAAHDREAAPPADGVLTPDASPEVPTPRATL
ncbi:MAG: tyrosine-type recombinase/integrase [Kineosporiaceae bacterium]